MVPSQNQNGAVPTSVQGETGKRFATDNTITDNSRCEKTILTMLTMLTMLTILTILRCEKTVYLAEMMRAAGQTFHKSCFTCQVFSILPSMERQFNKTKSRFATNAWTARCFARGRARSSVGTATARTNIHLMYFYQFFPRQKLWA